MSTADPHGPIGRRGDDHLRRIAIADQRALERLLGADLSPTSTPGLDARTCALVWLAALVGVGASPSAHGWSVTHALANGASDEAIAGVPAALVPIVGAVRVDAARAPIELALTSDEAASERSW